MATPRGTIAWDDVRKVFIGFAIAAAGGALTFIADQVIPMLHQSGVEWKLTVAAILMSLVNLARKWLTDTRPTYSAAKKLHDNAKPDPPRPPLM